ncbi:MAG: SemiSWEET family transporter [Nanoarchaeota archaeon]
MDEALAWTLVGFTAGFFTSVGAIPQIWKGIKTKKMDDLSVPMVVLYSCGAALWFVYGLYLKSWPMIIVNIIFIIGQMVLVYLKMKYRHKEEVSEPITDAVKQ